MEQRDYLLRQIQLMTQAIVTLIRRLTGLKEDSSGSEEEIQQATNEMLSEQLGMELDDILNIPLVELTDKIVNKNGIHLDNLDLFAEVIFLNAEACIEKEKREQLLLMALELFSYTDRVSATFSIDRQAKINTIKSLLDQNE